MKKQQSLVSARASLGVLASAIAAALGSSGAAHAQQADEVEEVVVTGSRIVRRDFEANSPILTVDAERFEESSTIAIESVVNQLPQFVPAATQFESDGQGTGGYLGGATRTPGASTLSLRGLGVNRNLVLLDGRRAMPVNANMAVNINTIPSAALERVETISGGASSVYGADAIAGVVNFVLRRDFEGVDLDVQWGQTAEGDGAEERVSALMGANFADGGGNVLLGLEHAKRGEIRLRDREFYRTGFADNTVEGTGRITASSLDVGGDNPIAQSAIDEVFSEVPPGTVSNTGSFFMNSDGTVYKDTSAGAYRYSGPIPTPDVDGRTVWRKIMDDGQLQQNRTHLQAQLPLERDSVFARAHIDMSDSVTVFAQALFSDSSSRAIGPVTPFIGGWRSSVPHGEGLYEPSIDENGNTRPAYQAGGPLGLQCPAVGGCTKSQAFPTPPEIQLLLDNREDPEADFEFGHNSNWAGGRTNVTDVTSYQATVGFEGELPNNDWTWELYGSHGQTRTESTFHGLGALERWRFVTRQPNYATGLQYTSNELGDGFAAGTVTCTSGLPIVYGVNGWSEDSVPSKDCMGAVGATAKDNGHMQQTVGEFHLQGGAFDMPAGRLRFALGASYRKNTYEFLPDTLKTLDSVVDMIAGVFPADASSGHTSATEAYGELLVPLLVDKPAAQALNLELGYRSSKNEPTKNVDSYKALLDWRIHDRVRFRGGRQTANRSPNVAELFQAQEQNFVFSARGDWCSESNPVNPLSPNANLNPNAAEARALCEALMGPAGAQVYYASDQPDSPVQFRWVNLVGNPELEPETAETTTLGVVADINDRTTLSVDYWRIEISDMVTAEDIDALHTQCFDPITNPAFDPSHAACQSIGRDPFDGSQSPHTATYTNEGAIDAAGIDIQLDWTRDVGPGQITVNLLATVLDRMKTRPSQESEWNEWKGTSGPSDLSGVQGFSYDYRTLTTLGYSVGPWTTSVRWRHLPSIDSEALVVNPAGTQQPTNSYDIFDVAGRYQVNGRWGFRYGIDNLFDKEPEITFPDATTSAAGSTNRNFYDILGRRYYLGLNIEF